MKFHPASSNLRDRLGFIQGRLSPQLGGKIQAFPRDHWRAEFPLGDELDFGVLEWTLDHEGLRENPLLTEPGRAEILTLCRANTIRVDSITGDCFMQQPFFKLRGAERRARLEDLTDILRAAGGVGARFVVFPLVDNGHLENADQRSDLVSELLALVPLLQSTGTVLVFESDFPPAELRALVDFFPTSFFGVNYDTGNSAALGFDPGEEFAAYGHRVLNIHIKDRKLNGGTVPLGEGACDFTRIFAEVRRLGYAGNFVLQTARAADGRHANALKTYREFVVRWISG